MSSFPNRPAVIAWTIDKIDGLPERLRNAVHEQVAAAEAIKGDPERVAKAPGVDLVAASVTVPKRIALGNGIARMTVIDIDTQNLAIEQAHVLGVKVVFVKLLRNLERIFRNLFGMPSRVVCFGRRWNVDIRDAMYAAAIAEAEIQVAVWTEGEATAIVLAINPVDLQKHALTARIDDIGIGSGDAEFRQAARVGGLACELGVVTKLRTVVHIDQPILGKLRMEIHTEETAFVESLKQFHHPVTEVEKRFLLSRAIGSNNEHLACLFADKAATGAIIWLEKKNRCVESIGDELDSDFG